MLRGGCQESSISSKDALPELFVGKSRRNALTRFIRTGSISRIPQLYGDLSSALTTDLGLGDILNLAPLALHLTNAEHRIMEVIWARGSATVAEVVEALNGKDAYTTILTLMRILKAKGFLASRQEGRAFVFVPKVDRRTAARKAVQQLLTKFFAGSPSELVLSFLREEEITPEELDLIKRKITDSENDRREQ